ncbi:MAG: DUF262 domain-containing HNH endonuclease family protein [Bacteroidales bacterium]|nr:DUF262 domain-containing HNH endonuclease family protein [Bacteroidales bacterium]
MAFSAEQKSINYLLTNKVLQIPRNQRHYVWKESNWIDLLEDLKFTLSNEDSTRKHFIGCIVLQSMGNKDDLSYYEIIDGQQRSITIVIMLAALMKLFKERALDRYFEGTSKYLFFKDAQGAMHNVISSEYQIAIHNILDKLNSQDAKDQPIDIFIKECQTLKQKDKQVCKCLKHMYDHFKAMSNEELITYRQAITDMQYVHIEASTSEDSYTVFEILNARGISLEESELVKNYIMRYIQPHDAVDVVKAKWDEMENTLATASNKFFKHYATHRFGHVASNEIFTKIKKGCGREEVSDLMNDLVLKSQYYSRLINPHIGEDTIDCSEKEYPIFQMLKTFKAEQVRPVFLSLIHAHEYHKISTKKYIHAIESIFRFFICYSILAKEKSNKLQDTVDKYSQLIEKDMNEESVDRFLTNLYSKMPSKEVFLNAFKSVGWSHAHEFMADDKCKNQAKAALILLEIALSSQSNIEWDTIEHINRDSDSDQNYIIGNLLPLEHSKNTTHLSEMSFDERLEIYASSRFATTREFAKNYKVKTFDPKIRTEYMGKYIYDNILMSDKHF